MKYKLKEDFCGKNKGDIFEVSSMDSIIQFSYKGATTNIIVSSELLEEVQEDFTNVYYLMCIKNVVMSADGTINAYKGKVYECSPQGTSFSNESGNKDHQLGAGTWKYEHFRSCTEEEIFNYLVQEAVKKGFKVGSPVFFKDNNNITKIDSFKLITENNYTTSSLANHQKYMADRKPFLVVYQGSYTLPLEECSLRPSVTIGSYKSNILDNVLHVGCNLQYKFTKKDIQSILDVQRIVNQGL